MVLERFILCILAFILLATHHLPENNIFLTFILYIYIYFKSYAI